VDNEKQNEQHGTKNQVTLQQTDIKGPSKTDLEMLPALAQKFVESGLKDQLLSNQAEQSTFQVPKPVVVSNEVYVNHDIGQESSALTPQLSSADVQQEDISMDTTTPSTTTVATTTKKPSTTTTSCPTPANGLKPGQLDFSVSTPESDRVFTPKHCGRSFDV